MNKEDISIENGEQVPSLHQVDRSIVTILTRMPLHQREYERSIHFSAEVLEIDAASWDWLYPAFEALAMESQIRRIEDQRLRKIRRCLKLATSISEWHNLIALPAEQCDAISLAKYFRSFDYALESEKITETAAADISRHLRKFILRYFEYCGNIDIRDKMSRLYSPLHSSKTPGRQLISDMPWPGRPPISATPHGTYAELRSSIQARLTGDLDSIISACCDVLDRYEAAISEINRFADRKLSNAQKEHIVRKSKISSRDETWSEAEIIDYISICARERKMQSTLQDLNEVNAGYFPPASQNYLRSRLFGMSNGTSLGALLSLDIAPPGLVLLACALIIQRATHWNFISVLELNADQLAIRSFPHRIQSVKPKTEDETPAVWVEKTDVNVIRAFRVLCERRTRMVNKRCISNEDKRLWFSSASILAKKPGPLVSFSNVLMVFVKIYKFPKFSLEQMRVQCLATVAAGVGGVNEVIWSAGHSNPSTSLHYIDKTLIRRMLDASNLEFEWRLEGTVKYMMDGEAPQKQLIAYPIGDGTSCSSPENPPNIEWLNSEKCAALNCSAEGGCPNRRIYMNEMRVEEVVRIKKFYLNNWRRLLAENPVRFERVQIDQMMFNYALHGVLKRGPYRHLVAKYESLSV